MVSEATLRAYFISGGQRCDEIINPPPYRPFPQDGSMKGSRAYLYYRVARDDGFSLELQKKELLQFAEQEYAEK